MASAAAPHDGAGAGLAPATSGSIEVPAVVCLSGVHCPPFRRTGSHHLDVSPARTRAVRSVPGRLDTADVPDDIYGWSVQRSRQLGEDLLIGVNAVVKK
ncbi:MAG TPA: hypothetical protein EYO94_05475, partial [Acidobacteria bacterium]|nr:hypothetical protein [Acidobacteriota bacterium]